jgi:protein-S-isoprenylcysteine O-methyltransferase Ste14
MLIIYLSGASLLVLFAFILFRIIVRNDYLNRGKLSPVSAFLEFVIFALHANFLYLFIPVKWPELPSLSKNSLMYYPSLLLIILGLAVVLASIIPLGYRRTMGLKSHELKKNGLYKITRNPQVVGYFSILVGLALSYPSFYALGWIIIFGIIIHMMVMTEEEYLRKIYGKEYSNYLQQVPRYLGIISRSM